jgi:hypothetical protein
LPDGIFSNQKSLFGEILEGLAMGVVGIFYGNLVHFTTIWYSLWPSGIFFRFGMLYQEKSGNPVFLSGVQKRIKKHEFRIVSARV